MSFQFNDIIEEVRPLGSKSSVTHLPGETVTRRSKPVWRTLGAPRPAWRADMVTCASLGIPQVACASEHRLI